MTQRRLTTLAALLLAALLLAGCGGGGGGEPTVTQTVHDELQAELDTALAALARAEAAQKAAEDAQATADAARKTADEARAAAEAERDTAKAAEMAALAAEAEALATQAEAVAAEMAAKAAQTAAEAARDAAVQDKTDAEAARDAAREGETAAKVALIEAQAAQTEAERQRDNANAAKMAAEAAQATAEAERDAANTARQTAETARDVAQAAKTQAESDLAAANASRIATEADLATARQQLADANAALATANANLQTATQNLNTANANLAAAEQARDDARDAEREALRRLAVAEGTLEGLRSQLTQAQQDAADAEQRRLEAEQEANRRVEEAEQQANVSVRVPQLIAALDLDDSAANTTTADVTHTRGSTLTFMPAGSLTLASASAPSVPGSWRSASFSGQRGAAGTDTAYLYTNIQSPGSRAFWKIHGESVAYDGTDSLAKPSGLPAAGRSLLDPDGDGTDITNPPAMRRLGGTYDGAGGTFECTGTDCNIARADDGTLTASGGGAGGWTFKPGSLNAGVNRNQDEAYLYFGVWAYEPNTPTAAHEFKWIAGGDINDETTLADSDISATNFGALTGSATFTGGAVGKYVLRNQVGQADRIGTFTATATLTANFDTGPDLATAGNRLDGNLTGFRENGNALDGWTAYLGSNASQAAPLGEGGPTGTLVTTASIGGVTATGGWDASLHGADNAYTTLADNDDYTTAKYPAVDVAGVAGWFDAFDGASPAASNAAIAGAFGAACTSGSMCAR